MAELNANQKRALKALLSTPSVAAAARVCGLSLRTLWRYLSDPVFKAELSRRQDGLVTATAAALVGLSGEAVTTLHDALIDKETPIGIKVRVARDWLAQMRQSVELADLTQRVEALEASWQKA